MLETGTEERPERLAAATACGANESLELREAELDGIEVRALGWPVPEGGPGSLALSLERVGPRESRESAGREDASAWSPAAWVPWYSGRRLAALGPVRHPATPSVIVARRWGGESGRTGASFRRERPRNHSVDITAWYNRSDERPSKPRVAGSNPAGRAIFLKNSLIVPTAWAPEAKVQAKKVTGPLPRLAD